MYEDYGANYELVQRDVDEIQQGILAWPDFDRAIEALSAHVNPVKSREANRKKAMTFKDLLIKVSSNACHVAKRQWTDDTSRSRFRGFRGTS